MEKYDVTGMSCAACSSRVEKAVKKVSGVQNVSVNLLTNSMTVDGTAASADIIKAVTDAGYGASLQGQKKTTASSDMSKISDIQTKNLRNRFFVSLGFLLVLMYFSMGHMMFGFPLPAVLDGNHVAMGLIQLLLASIIMVINQKFFISGFKGLIHKAPNMDTLVSLGSGASYIYSVYALFAMTDAQLKGDMQAVSEYMDEFYFESAAMILVLITIGKTLESISKGKTTKELESLMNLSPKTAVTIRDGKEITVPVEEIKPNDIFIVKPGAAVAVDGVVIEGSCSIDESALTGESIPVDKSENDRVSAGTINKSGYIKCRAEKTGEDTALSQIIKMVSDASASKAPIAKAADKVSGIFVPTVMTIAIITIIIWLLVGETFGFALARGISVLVISCPCALGLATPVAIMVGNGVGAKNGILFKNASALEEAGKTQIVTLDKTGTITKGEPEVIDIICCNAKDKQEVLNYAYSLERKSEHPLAKAIINEVAKSGENNLEVFEAEDFKVLAGYGVEGKIDNVRVSGGSLRFIRQRVTPDDKILKLCEEASNQGKTPLLFEKNSKILGIINVADTIKEDSAEAIKELKNMGILVYMLTGDNKTVAHAIGEKVGVDGVVPEVLPDEKEKVIRKLKEYGKVAMVGDGINDAPALCSADTGIAIGAGTDVAIDAADVVLMKSRLTDVAAAIRLSRKTLKNIHENLFWAFIYNIIGIPLAAGAWIYLFGWKLNPMFGAAAMSLSSFCVVMNALRLNLFDVYNKNHDRKNKKLDVSAIGLNLFNNSDSSNGKEIKMTKTVNIKGMMCGHCESTVKKGLEAIDGIENAEVSHEKGTAIITLSSDVSDDVIKKVIEDKDFEFVSVE